MNFKFFSMKPASKLLVRELKDELTQLEIPFSESDKKQDLVKVTAISIIIIFIIKL
jgi:hypothetical protein